MTAEADPPLRRTERSALWIFAITAVAAAASGGGMRAVLGVVGGALLAAVSYRGIRAGVAALAGSGVARDGTRRRTAAARGLVKFITRFAILGLIAYVMMVRLRAQPVWMLLGASSLVAAAALEAARTPRAQP